MKMPTSLLALMLLLLVGCTTVVTPQGEKSCFLGSGWGVVNNTVYDLDVFQDGAKVGRLAPGQVVHLPPKWCASLVSVSAYDQDGIFRGANSYTFYGTYNWQIDHVQRPEGAQ